MADIEKHGEPSSPRRSDAPSDDEDFGMGLGDLLPVSPSLLQSWPVRAIKMVRYGKGTVY